MRIPARHLSGLGDSCIGGPDEYDASGNLCCIVDQWLGLCVPVLSTATGTAPANLTPPAPLGPNYNPDVMIGQMQGAALEQNTTNQAVAAGAGGAGTPAATPAGSTPLIDTTTWVLLGVAGVLGVILTMKR